MCTILHLLILSYY